MLEIETQYNHLQKLLDRLKNKVQNKESLRETDIGKFEKDITQCKSLLARVEFETRDLNSEQKRKWRANSKAANATLKELETEITWIESTMMNNAQGTGTNQAIQLNELQMQDYGKKVQHKDLIILDSVLGDIQDTMDTATGVAEKVVSMSHQIQRINNDVYEIEGDLNRAKVIVKRMVRRTMTDKCLWLTIFLIAVLIVVIILKKQGIIPDTYGGRMQR
eukprot:TRINITY_DN1535_c0_g1_i2.p1 TRINITY_DN1535_c0_g1~~TRINITY_DN1535_c0_g1_i2.p1  ORF type:complete len:220 (-),score=44.07 TRINITY_DN1535_c0_g1_i2:123-782(-)